MHYPRLIVDLTRLRNNVARTLDACSPGIEVMGVTKGVSGDVTIAETFVQGGIGSLGDARLLNLDRLRRAGLGVPLWLIRAPGPSEIAEAVGIADGSLNADPSVLELLGDEAMRQGKEHRVLVMVDLDTGREGLAPGDLPSACEMASRRDGLRFEGVGVYFDFRSDPRSLASKLEELVGIVARLGVAVSTVSGGASNVMESVLAGTVPSGVNHLRLGTAPLLGLSTSHGPRELPGWDRGAFRLEAEVIEVKKQRREALLSLGHLEAPAEYLFPTDEGIVPLRASSDHTVIDFRKSDRGLMVGDVLAFHLGYTAMSRAMLSPHTRVVYR